MQTWYITVAYRKKILLVNNFRGFICNTSYFGQISDTANTGTANVYLRLQNRFGPKRICENDIFTASSRLKDTSKGK